MLTALSQDLVASEQVALDSIATAQPIVTPDTLVTVGGELSETGKLLINGQWSGLWEYLAGGFVAGVSKLIPDLIGALFVFLILYAIYRGARSVLDRLLTRSRRVDASLQDLLIKTFRIVVWIIIGMVVLAQFGVNITALLAGLGVAGIAVGLGAKDTIENFISGITILIDRPFVIGDQVSVETTYGTVEEITLRSTRVRTRDNRIMIMPNVHMINQKIHNHSQKGLVRVEVPFGIAYKEFPEKAREAILETTKNDPRLRVEEPAAVVVLGLGNSSIDMALWLYVIEPAEEQTVRWDYAEKIRETLREAGIEIPFPHLQLFFDEAKAFEKPILIKQSDRHGRSS